MQNKLFLLGMAGVLPSFGLLFTSCQDDGGHGAGLAAPVGTRTKTGTTLVFNTNNTFTNGTDLRAFKVAGGTISMPNNGNGVGIADFAISGTTLTISNSGTMPNGDYTKQ